MAFIEEEWWKDTKWFKFFLAGCFAVLLFIAGGTMLFPHPDMSCTQSNFDVEIPTNGAAKLYRYNTQGWFGDGQDYSVWQYQDADKLMESFEWEKGQAFLHETFIDVTTFNEERPEGYFLPREVEQEVYYYHQDDGDNRLLLIFAPEVKLGDGKYYDNLLFVAAWYS